MDCMFEQSYTNRDVVMSKTSCVGLVLTKEQMEIWRVGRMEHFNFKNILAPQKIKREIAILEILFCFLRIPYVSTLYL